MLSLKADPAWRELRYGELTKRARYDSIIEVDDEQLGLERDQHGFHVAPCLVAP